MIKSAFQNHFAQIPQIQRPRSQFKRPSREKHTFDEGYLVPFYLDEVVPGATMNVRASMFARLATPIFPLMDNMYLETFWFFVPNRLVWTNFVKQHGEQTDPDDSTDYTTPVIDSATVGSVAVGSLWDNFGLPMVGRQFLDKISALPFRMYNLIWNEWFRDQDIDDSLPVPLTDGPDSYSANYELQRIRKYKDYFTTMRPAPQKGPAVELPIGGTAPVAAANNIPVITSGANILISGGSVTNQQMRVVGASDNLQMNGNPSTDSAVTFGSTTGLQVGPAGITTGALTADLTTAVGPTINEWRELVTIQQMYELDMRGGTRYIEMIFNHYGVVNPDFRLQRPEFLGYAKSQVNIHPVAQNSSTDATTPQGNLAAFGTVASHGNGFNKSFTEFGYVMGLVAVRADLTYQECVDKHWSRQSRFDYYYPIFANLGEQAVLNQELQVNPAAATDNEAVAGYQERWGEYRYKTSKITGLFRSSAAQSLEAWHLAQELTFPVDLDSDFIKEDAPVDRVIAVDSEPHFIFDSIIENITAVGMPMYSAPGLTRL